MERLFLSAEDYQIDSFSKLKFLPKVFKYLGKITKGIGF